MGQIETLLFYRLINMRQFYISGEKSCNVVHLVRHLSSKFVSPNFILEHGRNASWLLSSCALDNHFFSNRAENTLFSTKVKKFLQNIRSHLKRSRSPPPSPPPTRAQSPDTQSPDAQSPDPLSPNALSPDALTIFEVG